MDTSKKTLAIGCVLTLIIGSAVVAVGQLQPRSNNRTAKADAHDEPTRPDQRTSNPLDANRAMDMLNRVCAIGPRISGTAGMRRQQELLTEYFTGLGAKVELQEFNAVHPATGQPVTLGNLVASWHPERNDRVLICAHYDTRPFPDRDPIASRRRDPFIGANDGASGVALLAELAHHVKDLPGPVGVDFVLFDAEELIYVEKRDPYFVGSEYFAKQYRDRPREFAYRYAVLVDMVGDADLRIYQELFSLRWRDSRPLVKQIWTTAKRLGVREFVPRGRYEVRDDHLALHDIAGIPSCDIIDFEYPIPPGRRGSFWHTTLDTPDKCAGESIAKVGWVLLEWLKSLE